MTKTMDLELAKHIIETWTYEKIDDPQSDKDALQAIVSYLTGHNDIAEAEALINAWRKHKIEANNNRPLIDF